MTTTTSLSSSSRTPTPITAARNAATRHLLATQTRNVHRSIGDGIHSKEDLLQFVQSLTGLTIPTHPVCPNHQAPFDYLRRAFFEPATDLVVWAPRGGGKTRLGAIATLLDLVFKPRCQVRILGGSLEQSLKMWEHLHPDLLELLQQRLITGRVRNRRVSLHNGAAAAVLTQSQRAVRGLRVQKLRCDEVELFDPQIWKAAQLATRSLSAAPIASERPLPPPALSPDLRAPIAPSRLRGSPKRVQVNPVAASIEAISTLHSRFGLMHQLLDAAQARGTPIIKWCILDVLEHCPPERDCKSCPLWDECRGLAKLHANGHVRIDDAIAMKQRVSQETWESEMLCRRPSVEFAVFPGFDESLHVRESVDVHNCQLTRLWLAIDFGFSSPFVCLWIDTARDRDGRWSAHVLDEYVQKRKLLELHVKEIQRRLYAPIHKVACDPAGNARNDQTATSNVSLLRKLGYTVRSRTSPIVDGLERVRRALTPAAGTPTLFIHPRCKLLIRAIQAYRYEGDSEIPFKDGEHDHLIDALRYYFINREEYPVKVRCY